ncbi:HNH endonuclease [Thermanaerothrix sp. 4228-RoL]|jgi:5-methylcytosine-specific restriction endonuclease McrA|uniref:HNH endonuclease n=1 Tax=Thermanaerothrix solaris TaxID=3058434 RepID=A0ABU3NSK9_9CHLR|nr:HNH endonuclease [Thermanaerothrix sp. 4228-RoL]MDT8899087.1 HNH endonuclease [Thermanaerothrix sp. 4228-RoL]
MAESVLVLNANFEPINVCNLQRAIGLILTNRATLVLNGRGEIHTVNRVFPRPSIIRLQHMVHRPRPKVKLTRREIFRRDNYTCQYCGRHTNDLTVDHVIPRHLGGQHTWTNVVTACAACNHRKGGRTLAEAGMKLLRQPTEPPNTALYIFGRHLNEYAEWAPFLSGW